LYKIIDFISKKVVKPTNFVYTGENSPWEIVMDLEKIKASLDLEAFKKRNISLAKYLPFLPIKSPPDFISLNEMATPLLKSKQLSTQLDINLYFKVEGKNPTGSFKDRGSALEVTMAKELGAKAIILASTGNMAASCACYAAVARMPCYIFVPEGAPMNKLAQVIAFGGHIVQIKGTYNDAAKLAQTVAMQMDFYLAGDYAPRVEGQKAAAFELCDQFSFDPPDVVIIPMGCGTNITAYAKGFAEYKALGLIDKIPQLIGVEATGAAAIVHSFNAQLHSITPLKGAETIASAIAVPDPIDGVKALAAIYNSKGLAIAVSDEEMLQAQYILSTQEGLFVESASAATVAALFKIVQDPIFAHKKIVCVLTGDGLKDAGVIFKAAINPPTIYPQESEFIRLYESQFFTGKQMIFSNKNQVLFQHTPTLEELKVALKNILSADYEPHYLEKIKVNLDKILQKGKDITVFDLQNCVQNALVNLREVSYPVFSVRDYEVTTGKGRLAQAFVTLHLLGEERTGRAEGEGPVYALINAFHMALGHKMEFELKSYQFDIRTEDNKVTAHVELKLTRGAINAVGRGSSPDLVHASIEAFDEAYNIFVSHLL